jgi:hypothetical protein
MHIGDAGKTRGETRSHLIFAQESPSPGVGASRGFKDGVLREECHDGVEVVAVERIDYLLQNLYRGRVIRVHRAR